MSEFWVYVTLGFDHITDIQGYDHILFVIVLCCTYPWQEWRKIAILVTAFTLGHSLTLLLSALDMIRFSSRAVEILIPATIIISALYNAFFNKNENKTGYSYIGYALAAFFGLIHGMGFSSYFKALLGGLEGITFPLFSFNLGIEVGQLGIVLVFLTLTVLATRFLRITFHDWKLFFCGAGAGIALILLLERWLGNNG